MCCKLRNWQLHSRRNLHYLDAPRMGCTCTMYIQITRFPEIDSPSSETGKLFLFTGKLQTGVIRCKTVNRQLPLRHHNFFPSPKCSQKAAQFGDPQNSGFTHKHRSQTITPSSSTQSQCATHRVHTYLASLLPKNVLISNSNNWK